MKCIEKVSLIVILVSLYVFTNAVNLFSEEYDLNSKYSILVQYNGQVLNVPYIPQPPNTQWCWAASAAMVLGSHGVNVQTAQVVMAVFNNINPNQTGSEQNILQALSFGGVNYQIVPGYLNFNNVKNIIDHGSPIIVCYQGSFAGHAVVLAGYNIGNGTVVIFDPAFGRFYNVPFGNSLSYGSMAGPLFWFCSLIPY